MKYVTDVFRGTVCPLLCFLMSCGITASEKVTVSVDKRGNSVASSMYGVFFEEINHAGDGGLYAELVCNRSFEELEMPDGYYADGCTLYPKKVANHIDGEIKPEKYRWTDEPVPGWEIVECNGVAGTMCLTKDNPRFESAPTSLELTVTEAVKPLRLVNRGYWGMGVMRGDDYRLRIIMRTAAGYDGNVTACLLSEEGNIIASQAVGLSNDGEWNDVELVLRPSSSDSKARLALEFDKKGVVWLDYVSLFPEKTFKNRPNGLRKDVAEMLSGLKPAFVRWPGGCVVEGITLDNRFEWKKTLGDPAARPGEYSTWGYRCSYGFGYYEMLQFCEDIGADAMYVCNVGIGCQFRMGDASPESDIACYVQDCMDAIEYAIGDESTEWGARRVADGHPAPFPLRYVEIGNENWGDEYDRRFDIFYKAIKEKYPQLVLISNHGVWGTGKIAKTDMIDPHYYVDSDFFYGNTDLFDNHPRGKYEVYVGEYACNRDVGGGNMNAALSEAAFIGGMERNGDLVTMASYAPLFENRHDRSWSTNLIWIDTDRVMGRASYYVQQMASLNRPDYNVENSFVPQRTEVADSVKDTPKRFIYSGYDERNGELVLKVVNATAECFPVDFTLEGVGSVERNGTTVTLAADSLEAENSWDCPEKIVPCSVTSDCFGREFAYNFIPYSYTILRIKAEKK